MIETGLKAWPREDSHRAALIAWRGKTEEDVTLWVKELPAPSPRIHFVDDVHTSEIAAIERQSRLRIIRITRTNTPRC